MVMSELSNGTAAVISSRKRMWIIITDRIFVGKVNETMRLLCISSNICISDINAGDSE